MTKTEREIFKHHILALLSLQNKITDKDFNNHDDILLGYELGAILMNAGGKNALYNMKYREEFGKKISSDYFGKLQSNQSFGTDLKSIPEAECKSATINSPKLVISESLSLGEIDKVHNKINNNDPKYSSDTKNHAFFLLFKKSRGSPSLAFYVNNEDFGKTIQPLLSQRNNDLMQKSEGLTKKSRDSLGLKLEHFAQCPSFDIAYINNDEEIFITKETLDLLMKNPKIAKSLTSHMNNQNIILHGSKKTNNTVTNNLSLNNKSTHKEEDSTSHLPLENNSSPQHSFRF